MPLPRGDDRRRAPRPARWRRAAGARVVAALAPADARTVVGPGSRGRHRRGHPGMAGGAPGTGRAGEDDRGPRRRDPGSDGALDTDRRRSIDHGPDIDPGPGTDRVGTDRAGTEAVAPLGGRRAAVQAAVRMGAAADRPQVAQLDRPAEEVATAVPPARSGTAAGRGAGTDGRRTGGRGGGGTDGRRTVGRREGGRRMGADLSISRVAVRLAQPGDDWTRGRAVSDPGLCRPTGGRRGAALPGPSRARASRRRAVDQPRVVSAIRRQR